jgi:NAD(P)-dependent dehydrogenase (short-subunit alcohol dehydrogenase family)
LQPRSGLCSLYSVRTFATKFAEGKYPPIGALVLNAGRQFGDEESFSTDGIESTFAVNHVGHVLLFYLLRDYLADTARLVLASSGVHDPAQKTPFPDADYTTAELLAHPPKALLGTLKYSTSKLCNILWMYALNRHIASASKNRRWTVNALDPGLVPGTGLWRDFPAPLQWIWHYILPNILPLLRIIVGTSHINSPAQSGQWLARLAVAEELEGVTGKYFEGGPPIKSSIQSYDEEKQENLWASTARMVSMSDQEYQSFVNL